MTRPISYNARVSQDEAVSDEVAVVLMEFRHPSTSAALRLSTDPTERLTTSPLAYGTRSTWRGADPATEPFVFAMVQVELPGEMKDTGIEMRMYVSALDSTLLSTLRSFRTFATCHAGLFRASAPDIPEAQWPDLVLTDASMSDSTVELVLRSRQIEAEIFPAAHMTQNRFPALYR